MKNKTQNPPSQKCNICKGVGCPINAQLINGFCNHCQPIQQDKIEKQLPKSMDKKIEEILTYHNHKLSKACRIQIKNEIKALFKQEMLSLEGLKKEDSSKVDNKYDWSDIIVRNDLRNQLISEIEKL